MRNEQRLWWRTSAGCWRLVKMGRCPPPEIVLDGFSYAILKRRRRSTIQVVLHVYTRFVDRLDSSVRNENL